MTMTLDLTADRDTIGEQLMKYGYSVATRKGFKGASLDDAAISFATGAWKAYQNLDSEKANGGEGLGYIYRGGMNGLVKATRTMTQRTEYKNQTITPNIVDNEEEYSKQTARARTLSGEYAPADLGDEGEGASLFDMIADPKSPAPDAAYSRTEQVDCARAFLDTLTEQEKRIMLARAEGQTYRAIGEAEGLSHEMVRKIIDRVQEHARFAA